MRTSMTTSLLLIAALTATSNAIAQTAPLPPVPPPPPTTVTTTTTTTAPVAPAPAPAPAAPQTAVVVPATAPATAPATGAAPAAPANWYDKFAADAFVDAYGAVDWNFPKSQGAPLGGPVKLRAFDTAQGFSLNWIGLNGSYAADPIGGTISLRFGPGAVTYHGAPLVLGAASATAGINPSDNSIGLQNVRQAYATWKPADKVTLDFGKFDQPYGSEVPDSQLNMEYTRSLLFTLNQPVFFTGLRLDYAPTDTFDAKLIVANGWNNSIDNNRGKSFGGQISFKPADSLQFYLGYMTGPEQVDAQTGTTATAIAHVPDANSHWRHLVDLVVDFNPTKEFRLLLNGDYDTEDHVGDGSHAAVWYGANLALRYIVADPFQVTLRGEYFHDEHGDILGTGTSTNVESGTLTLQYVIASHLALMLDNRIDVADSTLFYKSAGTSADDLTKTQFTTTLGVIASTK